MHANIWTKTKIFELLLMKRLVQLLTIFLILGWSINPVVFISEGDNFKLFDKQIDSPGIWDKAVQVRYCFAWPVISQIYHITIKYFILPQFFFSMKFQTRSKQHTTKFLMTLFTQISIQIVILDLVKMQQQLLELHSQIFAF